jgi:hypothetical protein
MEEESASLVDVIILIAGVALILVTSLRVTRSRSEGKRSRGQTIALVGITVWLACLAVALYLIFG